MPRRAARGHRGGACGRGRGAAQLRGGVRGRPARNIRPPARYLEQDGHRHNQEDVILDYVAPEPEQYQAPVARLVQPVERPVQFVPAAHYAPDIPLPPPALTQVESRECPLIRALRQLPTFDGTSYYDSYAVFFDSLLDSYPTLTEAQRGILLMRALTGKATSILEAFTEPNPSYKKLHQALLDRFPRCPRSTQLKKLQYERLQQEDNESLPAWRERVVQASWDAFGERREQDTIDKFVNNMRNPAIRCHVAVKHCTTLAQALQLAMNCQTALGFNTDAPTLSTSTSTVTRTDEQPGPVTKRVRRASIEMVDVVEQTTTYPPVRDPRVDQLASSFNELAKTVVEAALTIRQASTEYQHQRQ